MDLLSVFACSILPNTLNFSYLLPFHIQVLSSTFILIQRVSMSTANHLVRGTKEVKDHSFLEWFSGFVDAEGNFLISLDRGYIRFRFKILLHVDDIEVLNMIKSKLGIGIITVDNDHCSFVVQNFNDIKNVICPIFIAYPLLTNKRLDFKDFYEAVMIKGAALSRGDNLTDSEKDKILSGGKLRTPCKRESVNLNIGSSEGSFSITSNWFTGFTEGDGTFGVKNGSPYFQIAQKNTSQGTLDAIKNYIVTLPKAESVKVSPPNLTSATNKRTGVVSLVVLSIDSLYYYILPLFETSRMYSRKAIDFKLWRIALLLHKLGYYYLPEGRQLLVDISNVINKSRYSSSTKIDNIDLTLEDIFKRSLEIFATSPPFDLSLGKSHVEYAQAFSLAKRSLTPNAVYI